MKQLMASTRGMFDLHDGHKLKDKPIHITPKSKFEKLRHAEEIVIFVHGMRNSTKGAKMGTSALRLRLRKLGYKHPIIGFSYDSNVRGAHVEKNYRKVLNIAKLIANNNGEKLAKLIKTIHEINPVINIRLVGHSLGCEVVVSACNKLPRTSIEHLYLFGSPVEADELPKMGWRSCVQGVTNYYNPKDEVILEGVLKGELKNPTCLSDKSNGVFLYCPYEVKRIYAKDHRFKSQMRALRSFP